MNARFSLLPLLLGLGACLPQDATEALENDLVLEAQEKESSVTSSTPSTGSASTGTARAYPIYQLYFRDADGDGFGNPFIFRKSIGQPLGYVLDKTDCDDALASVHPGAPEACNGIDDDCDGGSELEASFGGHDYVFCYLPEIATDYEEARVLCQDEGMDLSIVESQDEQDFLIETWGTIRADAQHLLNHRGHVEKVAWIGYSDAALEDDWRWIDGSVGFEAWCGGEPNNAGNENCAVTGWTSDYDSGPSCDERWNDIGCDRVTGFICETGA